jgi:hypothetical protein
MYCGKCHRTVKEEDYYKRDRRCLDCKRAVSREYYHQRKHDAEWIERRKKTQQNYYQRNKADYHKRSAEWHRLKYETDAEYRERKRAASREQSKKQFEKIKNDPKRYRQYLKARQVRRRKAKEFENIRLPIQPFRQWLGDLVEELGSQRAVADHVGVESDRLRFLLGTTSKKQNTITLKLVDQILCEADVPLRAIYPGIYEDK